MSQTISPDAELGPGPGRVLLEGQLNGSASLSIVNRALASALLDRGIDLWLLETDPRDADETGLGDDTRLLSRRLANRDEARAINVHLRNAWPPVTGDMVGRRNGLVCWAWEESEIPAAMARRFNRDLDLILTTSRFVSRALERSGVDIPCPVVGNGADHRPFPAPMESPEAAPPGQQKRNRILHISTGLTRKAVDVLIPAFVRAFAGREDVELYIKTSPNPHNIIQSLRDDATSGIDDPPSIIIDDRDLTAGQISSLYRVSDAVVLVSRGEGFGLPLAEAMMAGVPVIAARHGGQADFCTDDTAWLVDSRPARSRSHVASDYGLWEDPDPDSLVAAMRSMIDHPDQARAKAGLAQRTARDTLTWSAVAGRVVEALSHQPSVQIGMDDVEIVSTWNETCGLATYAQHLFGTPPFDTQVARIWGRVTPPGEQGLVPDPENLIRIWGPEGRLMEAFGQALAAGTPAPIIWLQHHPGYFSNADMARLLPAMRHGRRCLAVTLHNVLDTIRQGDTDWLAGFDRVITHSTDDAEMLGTIGIRAEVLPHGLNIVETATASDKQRFTIGSFGFLIAHKNVELLVGAVALARQTDSRIHLVLANAVKPEPGGRETRARVEALIAHYRLDDVVTRNYGFLREDDLIAALAPCNLMAFLYGPSAESASGAARMALSLNRPMLLSRSDVFRDLWPISHVTRRLDLETVAEAVLALANDPSLLHLHDQWRQGFALAHKWPDVAARAARLVMNRE